MSGTNPFYASTPPLHSLGTEQVSPFVDSNPWGDDAATVIFGDDLLEPMDSRRGPAGPYSLPSRPGEGSLRPYMASSAPKPPSQRPPPPDLKGTVAVGSRTVPFVWGVVLALGGSAMSLVLLGNAAPAFQDRAPASQSQVLSVDDFGEADSPLTASTLAGRAETEVGSIRAKSPQDRSANDVFMLSLADEQERSDIARTSGEKLARKSASAVTWIERENFFVLAGGESTYRSALLALTAGSGPLGPDLIYETSRRFRRQPDLVEFADRLLQTPEVRERASEALRIVIDTQRVSDCPDVLALVERAKTEADSRAVRHMAKFASRRGCGPDGTDDCYPCLRADRSLVDALKAAQARIFLKL